MQNHAKKWFNNRSSTNAMAAIAIGAMLVFSVAGMKGAFADTIENTIAADVTRNTIDAGGTTTATYYVKQESAPTEVSNSGDAEDNEATPMDPEPPIGNNGCNAQDGTRLSIDVNFPSGVRATIDGSERASPITLTFDKCGEGNGRQITFSSNAAGSYQITTNNIRDNGIGLYTDNSDFTLTVRAAADTTKPELNLPSDITEEATGPEGRAITYTATATDNVDDSVTVTCEPPSGSTFKLGETTVNCSATDAAGNQATGSFKVTITTPADTTKPELNLPSDITEEATGPGGVEITYTATATDNVDDSVTVTCEPPSGSTFKLGETTVNCSATDAAGNQATGSFVVRIQDTTKPELNLPSDITEEATGPGGVEITYTATATDNVDDSVTVTCEPPSGSTFKLGETTVNCSATDAAGNQATGSFTVTVQDTTAPTLQLPSNIAQKATGPGGAAITYTATASDLVDNAPTVICTPPSGSEFKLGTTTVNCSATDAAGNTSPAGTFKVTVTLTIQGFYQPVDNNGVYNLIKAGSTVPLKFEVFAGSTELTDISIRDTVTLKKVSCPNSPSLDEVEEYITTGQTTFRYDTTSGQFIDNMKSPTTKGTCHQLTMTFDDGSPLVALFKTK